MYHSLDTNLLVMFHKDTKIENWTQNAEKCDYCDVEFWWQKKCASVSHHNGNGNDDTKDILILNICWHHSATEYTAEMCENAMISILFIFFSYHRNPITHIFRMPSLLLSLQSLKDFLIWYFASLYRIRAEREKEREWEKNKQ